MTLKTLGTEIKYARCNGLNTVEVRVEFCDFSPQLFSSQRWGIFFLIYSLYSYSPLKINGLSETHWKALPAYDFTLTPVDDEIYLSLFNLQ